MSEIIKAALVLGVSIIAAIGLWIYFSPYQSCVRTLSAQYNSPELVPLKPAVRPRPTNEADAAVRDMMDRVMEESAQVVPMEQHYGRAAAACASKLGARY